jgi:predicted DNA-binding antitoxin AbrB/MazE fold protein
MTLPDPSQESSVVSAGNHRREAAVGAAALSDVFCDHPLFKIYLDVVTDYRSKTIKDTVMSKTLRAVIHAGKIEPLEQIDLPEGSKVLVTLLPDEEVEFWLQTSQASLDRIWDNSEDDVYAELLKK